MTEPQSSDPDDGPDGAADASAPSERDDMLPSAERDGSPAWAERDGSPASAEPDDIPAGAGRDESPASTGRDETSASGETGDDPEAADGQVTAALAELDAAAGWPPADQVAAFAAAHETLQATLARIDDH